MPANNATTGRTYVVPAFLVVTVDTEALAELGAAPDPNTLAEYFQTQWDGEPVEFSDEDGETVCGTVTVSAAWGYEIAPLGDDHSTDAVQAALTAATVPVRRTGPAGGPYGGAMTNEQARPAPHPLDGADPATAASTPT